MSGIDNIDNMDNVDFDGNGKIKIFQEEGVLKSGLLTVILNAPITTKLTTLLRWRIGFIEENRSKYSSGTFN